jgi:hypothetical protein
VFFLQVKIFQPPHKRVEDAEERQRDLEQAFEDMYMLQTGIKKHNSRHDNKV